MYNLLCSHFENRQLVSRRTRFAITILKRIGDIQFEIHLMIPDPAQLYLYIFIYVNLKRVLEFAARDFSLCI